MYVFWKFICDIYEVFCIYSLHNSDKIPAILWRHSSSENISWCDQVLLTID
jgi:hypothetical protein